ncbi:MAG TPA: ABC transporter substrate-binding protein [Polyangiaceae bacterium]|nr:ABC transporter substrate-binding protein [Polyangiaceae bacterium]
MKKKARIITLRLAAIAFLQCSLGCSDGAPAAKVSDRGTAGSSGTGEGLELASWWVAAGEVDALNALIGTYQEVHPGARVNTSGDTSSSDVRAKLDMNIATSPPDVFQINAHDIPAWDDMHPDTLSSLDELFAESTVKEAVLPDVLNRVSVDEHVIAMPVAIHRENSLFFNRSVFSKLALIPPMTISELIDACKTIKAAGITPIALSKDGWVVRILFNEIAQGTMGTETFDDFITGATPVTDPKISAKLRESISTMSEVLTNYVSPNAGDANFGWSDAADEVFQGKAAMFLHGDWAKGYFVKLGWTPGIDFGQTGGPGASDLFWYVIDAFATPTLAAHSQQAHEFLSVVLSKEAQITFSRLKGSTPIRTDVLDQLDRLGQATLLDLVDSKHRLPTVAKTEWDEALHSFATDLNEEALYQAYLKNPP